MITVEQIEDIENSQTIYKVIVPHRDLITIDLDQFDRAVINSPTKTAADVLQSLEILAFRQSQQESKS